MRGGFDIVLRTRWSGRSPQNHDRVMKMLYDSACREIRAKLGPTAAIKLAHFIDREEGADYRKGDVLAGYKCEMDSPAYRELVWGGSLP